MSDIVKKMVAEKNVELARQAVLDANKRWAGLSYAALFDSDGGSWPRVINGEEVSFKEAEAACGELFRQKAQEIQQALANYAFHLRRMGVK